MNRRGRVGLLVLAAMVAGVGPVRAQSDLDRGRQLFIGAIRFANGGPPCAACHDTSTLARPGGGTMGPDLTGIAAKIGPQGISTALDTLYFPTMAPLFAAHPLTPDEREAVAAFLEAPPPTSARLVFVPAALGVAAVVGAAVFLAITAFAGRGRIHSVRLALLARAAAKRTS